MRKILIAALCLLLLISLCSCDIVGLLNGGTSESSESNGSETTADALNSSDNSSERSSSEDSLESSTESESVVQRHEHDFVSTITEPICVNDGYTTHECRCGYKYIDTFVKASAEHSFERGLCTVCGEIDYPDLINIISTEVIKANVSVKVEFANKGFGFTTQVVGISNGSGVIIKSVESTTGVEYYVLTNNHVVYNNAMEEATSYTNYYVIDYTGTQYKADCIARLAKYDLALMKFTSDESYTVLSLEEGNSEQDDLVVSLGQPEGQSNAITLGNVQGYGKVRLKDSDVTESNVTFDVLHHDAYINNGSSGGALLDARLNVIGINYAGAIDDAGENIASYAIPVEEVYNFFNEVSFIYREESAPEDELNTEAQTQEETEEVA